MQKAGKHRRIPYGQQEKAKDLEKINKKWLRSGIFLLLLGIVAFRFRYYLRDGFHEIAMISISEKVGIFLASAGYMLFEGMSVKRLAKVFHTNIKWKTGVGCSYYSSFIRVVTFGAGAGPAEIYYLMKEGMQPAYAFDVSLIQYLCQKLAVTFMGAASLVILFQRVEDIIGGYRKYFVLGVGVAVGITVGIILVLLSKKTADGVFWILDWVGRKRENWVRKIEDWKKQITLAQEGVREILREKKVLAEVLGWNAMKYFCWFCVPYLVYGENDFGFLFISMGFMAIATVMASVIPVPGGYGANEFMQFLLFEPVLGEGKTVSVIILYWVVTNIIPALIGGGVAVWHRRKG